jgi:tetrahedral aminopeptidase
MIDLEFHSGCYEAGSMKILIQKLVDTPGPSGYENRVRELVGKEIEPLVDEISVDRLGNLIARKGQPEANGLKIMLAAHLDELGLTATHIDEQGFVRFLPVGELSPLSCMSSCVQFLNGAHGIIGVERLADGNRAPTFENLFIDLGYTNRAECQVRVGDEAVFVQPFTDLGKRLTGKALDDRVGVAVLVEILRQMQLKKIACPHGLYFVFSVQEQIGARGAITAAFGVNPDLGIAIDATPGGDTPGGRRPGVSLGKGPAIRVRDGSTVFDPAIVDWMVRTAEGARMPFQLEVVENEYNAGRAIQLSRAGVPVGCLSLPCRYLHCPDQMMDYQDVQNSVQFMLELLQKPFISD